MSGFILSVFETPITVPERPKWMTPVDHDILRVLEESKVWRLRGMWLSPLAISVELARSNDYITRRMKVLLDRGMVERHHEHVLYRISEKGSDWINERLRSDEL